MFSQFITGKTLGDLEQEAIMSYDENEPLAVTFAFSQGDTFIDWVFARDLLFEVISNGEAGVGDIQLTSSKKHITLKLTKDPESPFTVVFPRKDVEIFLEQTENMVPVGKESEFLHIDAEWEAFSQEW